MAHVLCCPITIMCVLYISHIDVLVFPIMVEYVMISHRSAKIWYDNPLDFQQISSHPLECVIKSLIHDFAAHTCEFCGFPTNLLGVCSAYNLLINRQNGSVGHCCCMLYYFVPCAPTADVPRSN